MNTSKRLTALVLTLGMLLSMAALGSRVTTVHAAEVQPIHLEVTRTNPLYGGQTTETDLVYGGQPALYADSGETEYWDVYGAANEIRPELVARQEEFTVNAYCEYTSEDAPKILAHEVLAQAMAHTGVPTEGDYLLWQYNSYSASINGYVEDGIAWVTLTYTMSYYTDAAQEAEMDSAVADLLYKLNVYDADNYTKLKAIYEYICANITYDYDNLEDESYKLKHTAYAGLINGTCVCQGYALLLYRLALELGVDCRLIAGDGGGPHGWNIAQLDGLYYNLDSTWDAGHTDYDYFLVSPDNFTDHIRYEEYDTPEFHEYYPMADKNYCYHSYESTVTSAPTCTTEGLMTYTCTLCGDSYTETLSTIAHTYDSGVVTTPTCTEDGYTTHTCTVCGNSYTDSIVEATGHHYDDGIETTAPTCTEPGIMTYVCTVCNAELTEEIPVIAHDYEDGTCSVCGSAQVSVPEILSCYSKQQTSVKVTWSLVDGAEGYELWRTTDPTDADSWTRTKTITDGTTDRYTNQDLTIGQTYYYKVRAYIVGESGEKVYSDFSEVDYMPAAVVFDLPYSNATFRIRLRWNEVDGAHGYQIWRLNDDGTYSIVKTLGDKGNELTNNQGMTTAYSNTGLEAGKTYTYKMRAFMISEDGRKIFGAYSDDFTVAVMPESPVVTGISPKTTRALISWNEISGAAGYQIWMSTSESGSYYIVKSITDGEITFYTKYDLTSGSTYYFKVRAYTDVDGIKTFSDYSEIVSVKVQ